MLRCLRNHDGFHEEKKRDWANEEKRPLKGFGKAYYLKGIQKSKLCTT